ncbi:MAG: alcohol dehydrogenase catalytic domain-containing protein [Spirochaetales bacterium]|nr:alcohol dehydrogenase catalytic domain-containing protein [Spirochaetales bacterium]
MDQQKAKDTNSTTVLEERLFSICINWLRSVERRDFYQKLVEFCAAVLESDVCALFVKTTKIGDNPRVCLVAGKLPTNHPDGQRMNPEKVGSLEEHSYRITETGEKYDGITGRIATTGEAFYISTYDKINIQPGHMGRWDEYVWQKRPSELFRCMLGVPVFDSRDDTKVIGILKVENKKTGAYEKSDENLLIQIGTAISPILQELIENGKELQPGIEEIEYRVPRSRPSKFERNKTGEVIISHSLTAICHSDIYYFEHKKSRKKLDERLPMVLGHETTGEVYQVVGEHKYKNGGAIQQKDKVVVIPLIPCGTCPVCRGNYGENYCPSARFMASNAPGSLRTIYKYYPDLVLKIPNADLEPYAVFTEPMSNVVQMLTEFGFERDVIRINMAPFGTENFNYFHVGGDSLANIFDTITAEEPRPRTLFILTNPKGAAIGKTEISQNNIMVKGLGMLGNPNHANTPQLQKEIREPKILILGSGTMAYLLAILLHCVFSIPEKRIVVTGRNAAKLNRFMDLATRFPIDPYQNIDGSYDYKRSIAENLINTGSPGSYDMVFECVGDTAVGQNIDLALKVVKQGGIIAMEGITDRKIRLDFNILIRKNILLKGFYRGSLNAYTQSLAYIMDNDEIRRYLEQMIDNTIIMNGKSGFHTVSNSSDLEKLFTEASKGGFGRIVIKQLE